MFSAIILAGGSSTRMNGINKQLAVLEGIPVIVRSALAFERSALVDEIILAAPRGEEQDYGALLRSHLVTKLKAVTAGGATRFLSVKNALPKCSCEFIAVRCYPRRISTGCSRTRRTMALPSLRLPSQTR